MQQPTDLWAAPIESLYAAVPATAAGLSDAEAAARLARYGANVAAPRAKTGALRLLLAQFASPITILLFIAAALSIGVGERVDGSIILAILVLRDRKSTRLNSSHH